MTRFLIEPAAVLTGGPDSRVLRKGALLVSGGKIERVLDHSQRLAVRRSGVRSLSFPDHLALPGLIQSHIHLCQTDAQGLADDLPLLDWLRERIFPYEDSLTPGTMRAAVRRGLAQVLLSGTTCVMDMGSLRHTEVIAREIWASGIRAFFGRCLMDVNELRPRFCAPRRKNLEEAAALARAWHGRGGRIRYAFAPRFVLSCSEELLRDSFHMAGELPGARYHTHAAENPGEMEAVRAKFGMGNIEYFDKIGVVGPITCLAHCVHLSPGEKDILAARGAHVLHCPSANLKLASGIADVVDLARRGIPVSLGCDGAACNNRMDLWSEMRLASLLQKPRHGARAMPARETFLAATYGGARALGWENEVGSLEAGKAADVVLFSLDRPWIQPVLETDDQYYGALVYSGRPDNVTDVLIDGAWVVRKGRLRGH